MSATEDARAFAQVLADNWDQLALGKREDGLIDELADRMLLYGVDIEPLAERLQEGRKSSDPMDKHKNSRIR